MAYTEMRVVMYSPNTNSPYNALPLRPKERVEFLCNTILRNAIKNPLLIGLPDDVLCIFLAPEWFFRKPKPDEEYYGEPYSVHEKKFVIYTLWQLSKEDQFKNWLIIPGSMTWGYTVRKGNELEFHWYNTVHVIANGEVVREYHKQHDHDNFPGPYRKIQVVKPCLAKASSCGEKDIDSFYQWTENPNKYSLTPAPKAKSPFFDIDGLSFCIEICADFSLGTAVRKYAQTYPEGDGVDVHIVVAAGVTPGNKDYQKSTARKGGYLLSCNSTPSLNVPYMSAVYPITKRSGSVLESASRYRDVNETVQGTKQTPRVAPPNCEVCTLGSDERNHKIFIYHDLFPLPLQPINNTLSTLNSSTSP